jgi:uncharacterized membrane protein YqhA
MQKIFNGTRYFLLIAVIGTLLTSLALIIYGGIEVVNLIIKMVKEVSVDATIDKDTLVKFIEVIEIFLLGTVSYIISLGLYELFIDDKLELPDWLIIHDFYALKNKLTSVVIVTIGVLFLSKAVSYQSALDLLYIGGGSALVILALSYFLGKNKPH